MARWRVERIQRCRWSIRNSMPCSFGVMGKGLVFGDFLHHLHIGEIHFRSRSGLVRPPGVYR